jgi:hypothetical protein
MSNKWDKRISEIEKKMGEAGKLPLSVRGPYVAWANPAIEDPFADIKERLLQQYGTFAGAEFQLLSWGSHATANDE